MSAQKEYVYRKVLKYAAMESPSADFTVVVMQEVTADLENRAAVNPRLKELVQVHGIEIAPLDFSDMVMSRLEETVSSVIYKPVISRKTGLAIAATITIVILLLLFLNDGPHTYSTQTNIFFQVLASLRHIPSIYTITLMMSCTLLLADYFLRRYQWTMKNKIR
jgi:hypothetical protein